MRLGRVLALAYVAIGLLAAAAESPPPAVTAVLRAVAAEEPSQVLARLDQPDTPDHPLLWCARGQALQRLDRRAEAEAAYRRSLNQAPDLRAAHAGLAQLHALAGRWTECLVSCGAAYDPATATAAELRFWIAAAVEGKDPTVARHLLARAIPRHPQDLALRRLELQSLLEGSSRRHEALACAEALVLSAPADAAVWAILADLRRESGDATGALAALEASHLLLPSPASAQRLAVLELSEQRPMAAWLLLRPLTQSTDAAPALLLLAARAADEVQDPASARSLLSRVPAAGSDGRQARLLLARIAAQEADLDAAWQSIEALLAAGETAADVLAWAGSIAERRGEDGQAEACYRFALAQRDDLTLVQMRLAHLLHRTGRSDEAAAILAAALQRHPNDVALRSLADAIR